LYNSAGITTNSSAKETIQALTRTPGTKPL